MSDECNHTTNCEHPSYEEEEEEEEKHAVITHQIDYFLFFQLPSIPITIKIAAMISIAVTQYSATIKLIQDILHLMIVEIFKEEIKELKIDV